MAKSFKSNPAVQFISAATPIDQEDDQVDLKKEVKVTPTKKVLPKEATKPIERKITHEPVAGFKRNPEFIEKKTRRVQLMFTPTLYERIKKVADKEGASLNEFIQNVLEEKLKQL